MLVGSIAHAFLGYVSTFITQLFLAEPLHTFLITFHQENGDSATI